MVIKMKNNTTNHLHINSDRLLTLDILKGIAVWMIILVHSRQKFHELPAWLGIFDFGQMGCQIFFVVAGLFSMMSYERLKNKEHSALKFYKKRLISIIPAWYAAIFIIYILNTLSLALSNENIGFAANRQPLSILCNLLLLHGLLPFCNNNVAAGGWFIGTIAIFYLTAPVIFNFMKTKRPLIVKSLPWIVEALSCAAIIALYLLTRNKYGYAVLTNNGFIYFSFVNQAGCFLLGASLYFEYKAASNAITNSAVTDNVVADSAIKDNVAVYNPVREMITCVIYLFLAIFIFFSGWKITFVIVPFIMGLFTYHLIKCMINSEKHNRNIFENSFILKILKSYGEYSFYIYLVHALFVWSMPIKLQQLLSGIGWNINDTLLYFILIIPMFTLSYYSAVLLKKLVDTLIMRIGRN